MSSVRRWPGSWVSKRLTRRPAMAVLLGLILVGGLVGAGLAARPQPDPTPAVRGVLVDLQASSLVHATRITLRADDGQLWTFQVDAEVALNREEPQSASHLRQHMAFGDPMRVRYRQTADGPLAVRIIDAPESIGGGARGAFD